MQIHLCTGANWNCKKAVHTEHAQNNAHFDGSTTIRSGHIVHEHVCSICIRSFALSTLTWWEGIRCDAGQPCMCSSAFPALHVYTHLRSDPNNQLWAGLKNALLIINSSYVEMSKKPIAQSQELSSQNLRAELFGQLPPAPVLNPCYNSSLSSHPTLWSYSSLSS